MAATAPPPPAIPTRDEIAEKRRQLQAEQRDLEAQQPARALRAAGGDAAALRAFHNLTARLADVDVQLQGLTLAEGERKRLDDQDRAEREAQRQAGRLAQRADVRRLLGDDLVVIEQALTSLGAALTSAVDHARQDQQVASLAGLTVPSTEVMVRGRLLGRLVATLHSVWPLCLPGRSDSRPLGHADVP